MKTNENINLIELNRDFFDQVVDGYGKKKRMLNSNAKLIKPDVVEGVYAFLQIVISSNYYRKQGCLASFPKTNKKKPGGKADQYNHEFLLCDGSDIRHCKLNDMPLHIHDKIYKKFFSMGVFKQLVELGLVERKNVPSRCKQFCEANGIRKDFYLKLTKLGKQIIQNDISD